MKNNKDLSTNITKVMGVYLVLILALITYIVYFSVFKSPEIAEMPNNTRLWAKRNEVLRGTIYDRDKNALTSGERTGTLTQSREYLYGDLYAHALGYVSEKYGLTGLEKLYDSELTNYQTVSLQSFLSSLDIKKELENRDESDKKVGNSLITTLDTDIQRAAYQGVGANKGSVVALNPKTGEILASVSKPTYDPNDLDTAISKANQGDSTFAMINRAVAGMYPPGSTFKVVTLASALENLAGVTDRTFNDTGKLDLGGGYVLPNYGGNVYGKINLKKALSVSSNIVFGQLALELGNDKLKETAEKFGFNQDTPANGVIIDNSRFPKLDKNEKGNIAQTGIGQSSILSTPMQMALVAATIANDGVMMEPRLVNEVIDKNGNTVKTIQPKQIRRVLDSGNASIIKDYMKGVVDDKVNSSWSYFKGTNAAGKTGTAETGVDGETPHSWFIGFAPADDPQIAVAVIVENGGVGSGIAAKIAGSVINTALGR